MLTTKRVRRPNKKTVFIFVELIMCEIREVRYFDLSGNAVGTLQVVLSSLEKRQTSVPPSI